MNLEFLILGGYGQFVWPAFFFTFTSFFVFYIKSQKAFQKQEKIFIKEFGQIKVKKIETAKEKTILSSSSVF